MHTRHADVCGSAPVLHLIVLQEAIQGGACNGRGAGKASLARNVGLILQGEVVCSQRYAVLLAVLCEALAHCLHRDDKTVTT